MWRGFVAAALLLSGVVGGAARADDAHFRVLYSFQGGPDGGYPQGGLLYDRGRLYGTTLSGGDRRNAGTVFAVDPVTGTETTLHAFKPWNMDGSYPQGSLIRFGNRLYGTTTQGGIGGAGTIYSINPETGTERVLHRFNPASGDGAQPWTGLTQVGDKLYGPASGGGANGRGALFSFDPATETEAVIYSFSATGKLAFPTGRLLNLGGTLFGTLPGNPFVATDLGAIYAYKLETGGLSARHVFNGPDGARPWSGLVTTLPASGGADVCGLLGPVKACGRLYGTTTDGGDNGMGAVIALDVRTGKERVLYSFKGGTDGANPVGGLVSLKGQLYGTTTNGGAGFGTVFQVDPDTGAETVLHSFNGDDGAQPYAGLTAARGSLYGTTFFGGAFGPGTVFAYTP